MKRLRFVLPVAVLVSAFAWKGLSAETVRVVDCVRDASLDVWAAPDVRYAHEVMEEVFKAAGLEPTWVAPGSDTSLRSRKRHLSLRRRG